MDKSKRPAGAVAACAAAIAASVGLAVAPGSAEARTIHQVGRYCATSWRNAGIHPQDWSDCTQEAISELLERVPQERIDVAFEQGESPERRELKRAIWRTIQRWRRAERFGTLIDLAASERPHHEESLELRDSLDAALRQVSPRQQRILELWSKGHTIDEIARALELSPARASDEKYKAIRKLRQLMEA